MKRAKQEFITAANGLEALQIYQNSSSTIKLIFMGTKPTHHFFTTTQSHFQLTFCLDISMPVMDGLTSTRHIRSHEQENSLPRTRIVALTCFSSAEYKHEALLSGIDLFLIKPVPMRTLQPILDMDPEAPGIPE